MKENILPDINLLVFKHNNRVYRGGYQEMYKGFWQKKAGCGPTITSNLFAYLSLTNEKAKWLYPYDAVTYSRILEQMELVWKYITPTIGGVNRLEYLAEGGTVFAKDRGVNLKANLIRIPKNKKKRIGLEELTKKLNGAINVGSPIGFLNLDNGEVHNLHKWHWVLIMGIKYDDNNLIAKIYNEGWEEEIDIGLWLETTKDYGGFVYFEII